MDDLIIDPDKLDLFAVWIEQYCKKQEHTMREYLGKMQAIADTWDDEKTYGKVLDTINIVGKNFNKQIDNIKIFYARHYRERAVEIRNRPK